MKGVILGIVVMNLGISSCIGLINSIFKEQMLSELELNTKNSLRAVMLNDSNYCKSMFQAFRCFETYFKEDINHQFSYELNLLGYQQVPKLMRVEVKATNKLTDETYVIERTVIEEVSDESKS